MATIAQSKSALRLESSGDIVLSDNSAPVLAQGVAEMDQTDFAATRIRLQLAGQEALHSGTRSIQEYRAPIATKTALDQPHAHRRDGSCPL